MYNYLSSINPRFAHCAYAPGGLPALARIACLITLPIPTCFRLYHQKIILTFRCLLFPKTSQSLYFCLVEKFSS